MSNDTLLTAARINALKEKIKKEMQRRSVGDSSLSQYAGPEYDFTSPAEKGELIKAEHGEKTAGLLSKVVDIPNMNPVTDGSGINLSFNFEVLDEHINSMINEPMAGNGSSCKASCAGLCKNACTGCTSCSSCSGCSGCSGCTASCKRDCTGCTGCTGCSGTCTGTCTGTCEGCEGCTSCVGECTSGCKGCTGTCSGTCEGCEGCTSCSGTCTGGCNGTCTGTCQGCNGCTSCSGTCKNGCQGCNAGCMGCRNGCQGTCKGGCKGCKGGCMGCRNGCMSSGKSLAAPSRQLSYIYNQPQSKDSLSCIYYQPVINNKNIK